MSRWIKTLSEKTEICEGPFQDAHLHISSGGSLGTSPRVERIFLNSTSPSDWPYVERAAAGSPSPCAGIVPFYGLHPWNSGDESFSMEALRERLISDESAAVGEAGLDSGPRYKAEIVKQTEAFDLQLGLACELRRPVSVHCVRSWQKLFDVIERFAPLPVPFILHSFYGSAEILSRLLRLGAYISVSSLSLRNPERSAPVIAAVPDDRLLIETDHLAGTPSFSADRHLQELINNYNVVAEIRKTPTEKLAEAVWENGTIFTHREAHRGRET